MLVVKSESSCSLTLVPGKAHLFSQDYPGEIQNDYQASPDSLAKFFTRKEHFLLPYHS